MAHASGQDAQARVCIQDLYGIGIRTPWPLAGVPVRSSGGWEVEFVEGEARAFAAARRAVPPDQAGRWTQTAALPDGARYRRWNRLFEFLVSPDARRIQARALPETSEEAFLGYLLVDALSFSMVRLGREPLHASAVVTPRGAVAFVGASGRGKSTLASLLVAAGCPLLTDDMLVLTEQDGAFVAEPGPPRVKLYRPIADRLLGRVADAVPMNAATEKLIVPLEGPRPAPAPLHAIYLLDDRGDQGRRARIARVPPAGACPRLLAATAGHWIDEPARRLRQFEFLTRLARSVPVRELAYRRTLDDLAPVGEAVVADLTGEAG